MFFKNRLKAIRRILMLEPIHLVLRELKTRNVRPEDLAALEVFGSTGDSHTKSYAPYVSTLDVWEIDPQYEEALKRNLPMAEVKITDSYKEIRTTSKKYNLIVVDNPMSLHGDHCEHFDLFPDMFRVAMDSAILMLNVIPEINDAALRKYPYLFNETQLACRKSFYKTEHPERVSFEEMVAAYKDYCETNGFNLEWHFFQKRTFVYYFVSKIRKLQD